MTIERENIIITILFSLVIITAFIEAYFSYVHGRKLYNKQDTITNIYLMTMAFVVNLTTKAISFFILNYIYQFRYCQIENPLTYWIALILAQDFLYWVLHSTGHYVRFFWAMHVTHHSSTYFNITTGFRSTVFEPLYRVFFYLPLALVGFTAMDILFAYLVTQIYGNLVHTQTINKLHPIIEYIFVTPSHHRVHHASNVRYLDKNMGMIFIIWDRLFGTFQEELLKEKVKYGITKPLENHTATDVIFHEFKSMYFDVKSASSIKNKLKYVFYPPGWHPNTLNKTAKNLRKELYRSTSGLSKQ